MSERVEVQFGAETSDLDKGSEQASTDIQDFREVIDELAEALTSVSEKLVAMGGKVEDVGEEFDEAADKVDEFNDEMDEGDRELGKLEGSLVKFGAALVAAFTVDAIIDWSNRMRESAVQTDQLAQRLGVTVEEASSWQFVMEQNNLELEKLIGAQSSLTQYWAEAIAGNRQYRDSFTALGIELDANISTHELFLQLADRFSGLEDGPRKQALAMRLLGESGAELIPIFNQGREGLEDIMRQGQSTGAVVSQEFVDAGLMVDQAFNSMSSAATGLQNTLFTDLAPVIVAILDYLTNLIEMLGGTGDAADESSEKMSSLGLAVKSVATAFGGLTTLVLGVFNVLVAATSGVLGTLFAIGGAIERIFAGDLAGAADVFEERMDATMRAVEQKIRDVSDAQEQFNQLYADLWTESDNREGQDLNLGTGGQGTEPTGGTLDPLAGFGQDETHIKEQLSALQVLQQANIDNFDTWLQLQNERLAIAEEYYGQDSEQYQALLREKIAMEQAHTRELNDLRRDDLATTESIELQRLQVERDIAETRTSVIEQTIARRRERGEISAQQEIALLGQVLQQQQAMELAHADREFQIRLSTLQEQLDLEGLRPIERERILNQIEVLEVEHAGRMAAMQEQQNAELIEQQGAASDAVFEKWQNALAPAESAISGMFQQLYQGSATFEQAFLQVLDKMLFAFVDMLLQMGVRWVAHQAAQTAAAASGAQAREGIAQAEQGAGLLASATTALAQIGNSAVTAAAGAYSALAAIPFVGPFIAPAAAAAALGAVLAFGSSVVSARQGLGRVERDDQAAILHKDEMVLPADIAAPLRETLAARSIGGQGAALASNVAGATAGGGPISNVSRGDTNLYYQPQHGGESDADLTTMLRRDASAMRKWLREEARNGRLSGIG